MHPSWWVVAQANRDWRCTFHRLRICKPVKPSSSYVSSAGEVDILSGIQRARLALRHACDQHNLNFMLSMVGQSQAPQDGLTCYLATWPKFGREACGLKIIDLKTYVKAMRGLQRAVDDL